MGVYAQSALTRVLVGSIAGADAQTKSKSAQFDVPNEAGIPIRYEVISDADKTVAVTGGKKFYYKLKELTIPATVNNNGVTYTVTELGYYVSEGVYTIPERYAKPEPQSFTLLDDSADAVKSVMFHNSVVVGSVSLSKRNKMGIELAGSQWALFTKDNQQIMFNQIGNGRYVQSENGKTVTLTTDSTGCLKISELPYGDYYFMEVQAPKGYLPYGEKIDFTISGEEKDVSLTVTDNFAVMYNTGSIGTAPIYIAGAAALTFVGAAFCIYRILKKKKSIKQNQNRSEK